MLKKAIVVATLFGAVLIAVGAAAYVTNGAPPVAAISTEDVAAASRPIVVKLHAQWCVYCRVTKAVWSQIEETYRGRAHFLVLDFTNDTTTEASRAEAARLGLRGVLRRVCRCDRHDCRDRSPHEGSLGRNQRQS